MNRLAIFLIVIAVFTFAKAAPPEGLSKRTYKYRNLMPSYWQFVATVPKGSDSATVAVAFRTQVVTPNAEIFDAVAFAWMNERGLLEFNRRLADKGTALHTYVWEGSVERVI